MSGYIDLAMYEQADTDRQIMAMECRQLQLLLAAATAERDQLRADLAAMTETRDEACDALMLITAETKGAEWAFSTSIRLRAVGRTTGRLLAQRAVGRTKGTP